MVALIPRSCRGLAVAGSLVGAAAGMLLSGCSSTTYGTGVNPGTQTLKDIAGIAMMGGSNKASIDYQPRAKVVAPPAAADASLPPPASGTGTVASADGAGDANPPNWPNDPDLAAAKFKSDVAAREARGEPAPKIKLPAGMVPQPDAPPAMGRTVRTPQQYTPDQLANMKKAFADAKGLLAVDAQGQPVRRYLTDPPSELRAPDTTQPVEFTEKKKKFHWFWQKQDDNDNLTPAASADATQTASTPPAANN